jgi:hypothetical protein
LCVQPERFKLLLPGRRRQRNCHQSCWKLALEVGFDLGTSGFSICNLLTRLEALQQCALTGGAGCVLYVQGPTNWVDELPLVMCAEPFTPAPAKHSSGTQLLQRNFLRHSLHGEQAATVPVLLQWQYTDMYPARQGPNQQPTVCMMRRGVSYCVGVLPGNAAAAAAAVVLLVKLLCLRWVQ